MVNLDFLQKICFTDLMDLVAGFSGIKIKIWCCTLQVVMMLKIIF
jgi:hypothetical protein